MPYPHSMVVTGSLFRRTKRANHYPMRHAPVSAESSGKSQKATESHTRPQSWTASGAISRKHRIDGADLAWEEFYGPPICRRPSPAGVSFPAPNVIQPQSPADALIFPPSRSPRRARPPARANYPARPVYGPLSTTKDTILATVRPKNAVRNWADSGCSSV